MDLYFFRCFMHANDPVLMKIIFFYDTVFMGQSAIQGISNSINNCALNHIRCCIRVDNYSAIDGAKYSFDIRLPTSKLAT